jgi:signal transduction histidine kinase
MAAHVTDDQRRRLLRIENSVKQMSELIDALLVLSRISRHTLHREIVDVSALAEQVVADLRQKDPLRSVHVSIQPDMAVHGDRRLSQQKTAAPKGGRSNSVSTCWPDQPSFFFSFFSSDTS